MKRVPSLVAIGVILAVLVSTNPYRKETYISHTTTRIQTNLCNQEVQQGDRASCEQLCKVLSPVTVQVLRGLLYAYTPPPRNYVLFSVFTSELPESELQAIGVAGHYIYISQESTAPNLCDFFESDLIALVDQALRVHGSLRNSCN
jgi:hypothetical protein